MLAEEHIRKAEQEKKNIKCVVWDLDNTLWQGTLLESDKVVLMPGVVDVIQELDKRGILQSIASKNDFETAWEQIGKYELQEYFVYPQINWGNKSDSIRYISETLNISVNTFAFIDDQVFEREEVSHILPEVLTVDAADIPRLLDMEKLQPKFITYESALRRKIYQDEIRRRRSKEEFRGNNEEFLATLGMCMSIRTASEQDLRRAEELTIRTNQLNTTGYTYSYEELYGFLQSREQLLLVAELDDKYGCSGIIGLALITRQPDTWILKLLIMSCRVMTRGVGTIMLSYIMHQAKCKAVKLRAEFVHNDRNRMMYVTYKFNGFYEVSDNNGLVLLENDPEKIPPYPPYITVRASFEEGAGA